MDSENSKKPLVPPVVPLTVLQIASDLRHNLAGIDRRIEALRARFALDRQLEREFSAVNAAIDDGFDAARELVAFARRSGDTGRVDANGLVHQTRGIIERMLGPGVRVYVDLSPSRPVVRGDVAVIEWVLLSLIVLGRNATGGRGAITVSTSRVDAASPDLPGRPLDGNWVLLTVSDTGLGMHQRLPAPLDESYTPVDFGTDISLEDIRKVVRKAGGSVHAQEIKPYGTHVHVYLPSIGAIRGE